MAARSANVTSTDAVRTFRGALGEFAHDLADVLVMFELEVRRPLEWIENDRPRYWQQQSHKASDGLTEARIALERCELTIGGDERRSCTDERKALQKAKRRVALCEEKLAAVKKWQAAIHKETEDFAVQIARLQAFLDDEIPRGLTTLDRMSAALEKYVQLSSGGGAAAGGGSSGGAASGGGQEPAP